MPSNESPEQLNAALDHFVTVNDRNVEDPGPTNELFATARFAQLLDRQDREPEPDSAFLLRLSRDLQTAALAAPPDHSTAEPDALASLNGQAQEWLAAYPSPLPELPIPTRHSRQRLWSGMAAAAVLLLTLLAGLATYRLIPTPASTPDDGTGMYLGNAARTGEMPGPGPQGKPMIAWRQPIGNSPFAAPVVAGGRVFLFNDPTGRGDYQLAAFDLKTGTPHWHAHLDVVVSHNQELTVPAAAGDLVYATTGKDLVAFQAKDGKVAWRYPIGNGTSTAPPAVAYGLVFITASDYTVRAIDAVTGKERWRVTIAGGPTGKEFYFLGPLVVADGTVFAENQRGLVVALDAQDGHQQWTFSTGGEIAPTALEAEGTFVVTAFTPANGNASMIRLFALDAKSGKPRWGPITLGAVATLAAGDGSLFVATAGGNQQGSIDAFELSTGKRRWTSPYQMGPDGRPGSPAYADGELYITNHNDGIIQRINTRTGRVDWSVYLDSTDPAVAGGLVVAAGFTTLIAVGGNGSATSAAATPVDLSGRPACIPSRPVPTREIIGTPSATIQAPTMRQPQSSFTSITGQPANFTNWPQILVQNLPTGQAASPQDAQAILTTLRGLYNCALRPEAQRQLLGFFTDDFFRRGIVQYGPNGYTATWDVLPEETEPTGLRTAVLPDGRIAAVLMSPDGKSGALFIVKQVNGHWLIDELYSIVAANPSGSSGAGG